MQQSADEDVLAEVESQLHKLAGSGGSFGYTELSRAARQLELKVRGLRNAADVSTAFDADGLAEQIADLGQHLGTPGDPLSGPRLSSRRATQDNFVVLLEPNQSEAERLAATLLQFGHDVRVKSSLDELAAEVGNQPPEALIIDLDCEGGGQDSIRRIFDRVQTLRDDGDLSQSVVFYLSTDDSTELRLSAARAAASGLFVKPIDPMAIVDRLELARQHRAAPRFKVLVVDDDILLARHHATILEAGGFDVEVVENPYATLDVMARFRPDLVLLDIYMPGCSGTELARVIRMHEDWLATPIVYLSAETDVDLQLTATSEGADDFLTKPISDGHLVAAARNRCERAYQMSMLINRDSLTGLLKHARIKEELINEVSRSRRSRLPLSVVMADIDHFKKVNDTYGHPAGDQVIRALGNLMRQRVRASDRIGRYGGEEFMLVLPNCRADSAQQLADDIRQRFKALQFAAKNQQFSVTLSAGIACSEEVADATALIAVADEALYRAKQNGRDRSEIGTAP
nr:diguanylate cyclase [Pseudomarimonas arenosa]